MNERTIRLGCVVAAALWVMTVGFILAGSLVALFADGDELPLVLVLLSHGLMLSAAAAAATIRVTVKDSNQLLRTAFNAGRNSVTDLPAPRRPQRV